MLYALLFICRWKLSLCQRYQVDTVLLQYLLAFCWRSVIITLLFSFFKILIDVFILLLHVEWDILFAAQNAVIWMDEAVMNLTAVSSFATLPDFVVFGTLLHADCL